ncbi:hypothetical protein AAD001_06235 [Colwelliaceae bacterium 6471]
MGEYNYKNLTQYIGETVTLLDQAGNSAELTIAEVNKGTLDGDEWESFSVIYHAEKDLIIPQGIYTFEHRSFAQQQLFLTPNSEIEYETVVSRERAAAL